MQYVRIHDLFSQNLLNLQDPFYRHYGILFVGALFHISMCTAFGSGYLVYFIATNLLVTVLRSIYVIIFISSYLKYIEMFKT